MQVPRRSTPDPTNQPPQGGAVDSTARCVAWCTDDSGLPPKLLAALARHNLSVEVCRDALSVSAALARRARVPGLTVLLLVEPDELAGAQRVLELTARRWPSVRCWEYRGVLGRRELSPAAPAPAPAPAPERQPAPPPVVITGVSAGPALRLTEPVMPMPGPEPVFSDPDGVAPPSHLLTDAELAMLLEPEPGGPGER